MVFAYGLTVYFIAAVCCRGAGEPPVNRSFLKHQVMEMFYHAYNSYMKNAFPADELMPLSCRGRFRGVEQSRGDIDEALGNYSLTLIDSLDTLAVFGDLDEFERACRLVVETVSFDHDLVISVFEANIRVVGGLLSAHVLAQDLRSSHERYMPWYRGELLYMARDLAIRLLPAFNTSSGIPYARINMQKGLTRQLASKTDTCTACAGSLILEFAALSRLLGEPIFELKARKAMDALWDMRHRSSDLMGTVLNINSAAWVRKDSGVGAGIDSYYEYCLKAYILLGDRDYLNRFNTHYSGIMRYISQGPLLVNVHMHRPEISSRQFMDALLAFWPGLQVLKGDIQPAIEIHEMLSQVVQKHRFLPEAFSHDFQVHWSQHHLRPEYIESTYFLWKATKDPYYLELGKQVVEALNKYARVDCGFATLQDVRTLRHEDRLDSFVLAETFKYLFLLFAEDHDVPVNLDNYVFTTEAHLLPLNVAQNAIAPMDAAEMELSMKLAKQLSNSNGLTPDITPYSNPFKRDFPKLKPTRKILTHTDSSDRRHSCPNYSLNELVELGTLIRHRTRMKLNVRWFDRRTGRYEQESSAEVSSEDDEGDQCSAEAADTKTRKGKLIKRQLFAKDFLPDNDAHREHLERMGIQLVEGENSVMQLVHYPSLARSIADAQEGALFMAEMQQLAKEMQNRGEVPLVPAADRVVQILSRPHYGSLSIPVAPAQFGYDLSQNIPLLTNHIRFAVPGDACDATRLESLSGFVAVVNRGDCMFAEKAQNVQGNGAVGLIILDNDNSTSFDTAPAFAMSGTGSDADSAIRIPAVFMHGLEARTFLDVERNNSRDGRPTAVALLERTRNLHMNFLQLLRLR